MAEATYPSAADASEEQSHSQAFNQKFGEFKKFVSTNFTRTKQVKLGRAAKGRASQEVVVLRIVIG